MFPTFTRRVNYFVLGVLSAVVALPSMVLLLWLQRARHFDGLTKSAAPIDDID